jgi:hypothetical protein
MESGLASDTADFFGRKARANSACLPASANATVGVDQGGMPMARKPVDFVKEQQEKATPAMEALAHLYKALLAVPPFTLKDGTPVYVGAYEPPKINEAGEAECGLDVKLPNGHLEFTLRNSGWGKSFVDELANKPVKRGREQ